jgi:hypothetical protein
MIRDASGLYFEIRALAESVEGLAPRAKAAIFGACGRALAPLVTAVEERSRGRWSFPNLDPALSIVEEFATGIVDQADRSALRGRLMASMPHGDDLAPPSSTYVQDVLICADAGLAAASTDAQPKSIWIQYALEPQTASMQIRDAEIIRTHGDDYWSRLVVDDAVMASALALLREFTTALSHNGPVDEIQYRTMVESAAILRPVDGQV